MQFYKSIRLNEMKNQTKRKCTQKKTKLIKHTEVVTQIQNLPLENICLTPLLTKMIVFDMYFFFIFCDNVCNCMIRKIVTFFLYVNEIGMKKKEKKRKTRMILTGYV